MANNKIFRCAVLSVLLICSVFWSCPFSVMAVDEDSFLHYEYNAAGEVVGEFYKLDESDLFMPFSLKSPNTSNDISWIPWYTFPDYIQEIAYCTYYNINFDEPDYYRTPFIMVTIHSDDTCTIRAGWDVGLWYRPETGSTTIGFYHSMLSYCEPELHMATIDILTGEVITNWSEKSYATWGNSGAMYNFPGSGINVADSGYDVYTYGVNACLGSYSEPVGASMKLNTDGELVYSFFNNRGKGILDSAYCGFTKDFYQGASGLYISSFFPFNEFTQDWSYLVYADDYFGINSNILKSSNFIPLDNLPYGSDSSVIGLKTASGNSFNFILKDDVESYFFRNWSPWSKGKLQVAFVSKSPIYRVGYTKSGNLASINGAYGLTQCSNNLGSGSTSWHNTLRYYLNNGYYVYVYAIPVGSVGCTITRNTVNLTVDNSLSSELYPFGYNSYPTVYSLGQLVEQEQISILDEQNSLIDEGNKELSDINDALNQTGDNNFATTLPQSELDEYNKAESELFDGSLPSGVTNSDYYYDADNLEDDLDVELDESALEVIWDIFDDIVTADSQVFALFISCLAIGIISLILGR